MYAHQDHDSNAAVTLIRPGHHPRTVALPLYVERSEERAVRGARLLTLRWLASRRRVTGLALAAAGWAAILAAVTAGRQLDRGAAAQVAFAAIVMTVALAETLLSSARPVTRTPAGAAGRFSRLGTAALVIGCLLGPPAGGAALGAGWVTSVLNAIAMACALASLAVRRLGRRLPLTSPDHHV
jgi:hypothetical protein